MTQKFEQVFTHGFLHNVIACNQLQYLPMVSHNMFKYMDSRDGEILEYACDVLRDKGELTPALLRTHLHGLQINELHKSALQSRVSIVVDDYAYASRNPQKQLTQLFTDKQIFEALNHVTSEGATRETKVQTFEDMVKAIRDANHDDSRNYSLKDKIVQISNDIDNDVIDEFNKKSLPLKNAGLRAVWDVIRPFPYCIASRPGFRKTDTLLNIMIDLAVQGKRGQFFSLEDSIDTVANKWIAISEQIDKRAVNARNLTGLEKQRIRELAQNMSDNLWVDDRSYTLYNFRKMVDKVAQEKKIDYICVDFIQLFSMPNKRRHEEIGQFCKEFINICKDYMIPVIFCSQVNDRDENKDGTIELDLGDLKDSANIEEYTRHVVLIQGRRDGKEKQLKTAKNTFGPLQNIQCEFDEVSGWIKPHYITL